MEVYTPDTGFRYLDIPNPVVDEVPLQINGFAELHEKTAPGAYHISIKPIADGEVKAKFGMTIDQFEAEASADTLFDQDYLP